MAAVPFPAAWCATGLGRWRPCHATYERFPVETLPPLDAGMFTGGFRWLGAGGDVLPGRVARLDGLAAALAESGLALPADFVTFMTRANFHRRLDQISCTACRSGLAGPLPSPVEPDARLVLFLRDQQDCVLWYLYLRPNGDTFVVHSARDLAAERAAPPGDHRTEHEFYWCAPTFEQFAYRFWIENTLWFALNDRGGDAGGLAADLDRYLAHYRTPGA